MSTLQGNLPPELILQLFGELDLVGLIKASCACKSWREFLSHPSSALGVITPERQALLTLYQDYVLSPSFQFNRETFASDLAEDFDEDAFLRLMEAGIPSGAREVAKLPTDFIVWIKEWPRRASDRFWPGRKDGLRVVGEIYYLWNSWSDKIPPTIILGGEFTCLNIMARTRVPTVFASLVLNQDSAKFGAVWEMIVDSGSGPVIHQFLTGWTEFLKSEIDTTYISFRCSDL